MKNNNYQIGDLVKVIDAYNKTNLINIGIIIKINDPMIIMNIPVSYTIKCLTTNKILCCIEQLIRPL